MEKTTFFHSGNATARLFVLKSLFSSEKKYLIITDIHQDRHLAMSFAPQVFAPLSVKVTNIGEIFALRKEEYGIYYVHPDIFRTQGNLHAVKKDTSLFLIRNTEESPESLIDRLIEAGYTHDASLSEPFTYLREGGTLHLVTHNPHQVLSLEWFDRELDSILFFDQRKNERLFLDSYSLPKKQGKNEETQENTEKKIPVNQELLREVQGYFDEIITLGCDFLEEKRQFQEISSISISELSLRNGESLGVEIPAIPDIQSLINLIQSKKDLGIPLKIITRSKESMSTFLELQNLQNIPVEHTDERHLESFFLPKFPQREFSENKMTDGLCILADDILSPLFVKKRKRANISKNLDLLITLVPGDLVVHRDHGIGIFIAIIRKKLGEIDREYLEIHYAGDDILFVPITEIFRISKYLGNPDITLTNLQSKEWEKTIKKTDEELAIIAEEILVTNARRSMVPGRAFGKFPDKEEQFQGAFPYEYTPDQKSAIDEVLSDMESPSPMDRLISGDVGFGKTEVAMNAAFKAVLSGTQVAFISPLVVLALEHFETLIERLSPFGVRIGILTRMNSQAQTRETLEKLKKGEIDILIGTHRLLSPDIRWKKLGLLIIDEEHKFGVSHKEAIKKMRSGIDILSLSATPIPRSLNLALSGLRKISLLTTPPKKRKPIETIITPWNDAILVDAIEKELSRSGQIIILHNKIRGLESIEREILSLFTGETPRIITTHGRMHGDEIEERIHAFKQGKYDILITTTIIENGVNFLRANTIIIIDPEDFGLASLHQLRGRVGRKDQAGFCYLMYRKHALNDEEKKRLITIANNNHLGAGFEIAMRDMEIRGAGEILGIAQSGKSKEVGIPLYFRMLEEKISELKAEKRNRIETKIELDLSYIIEESEFASELDKLNFYREIENIESLEELHELEEGFLTEHMDETSRENQENLFLLLRGRIIFQKFQIEKISKNGSYFVFDFPKNTRSEELKHFLQVFDPEKNMILVSLEKIRIEKRHFKSTKDFLKRMLEKYK